MVICVTSVMSTIFNDDMKVMLRKIVSLLILISLSRGHVFSQTKYEKESRINHKEVPPAALSFVDSLPFVSKVKWYKETGLNHVTIEAKSKLNKERHSVEFSEEGTFQDVEIEVKPSRIEYETYSGITEFLTQEHGKFKVEKTQIQYSGGRNAVLMFLRSGRNDSESIIVNFEIEISTKVDGSFLMFEYLFTEKGDYVESRQITSVRMGRIEY